MKAKELCLLPVKGSLRLLPAKYQCLTCMLKAKLHKFQASCCQTEHCQSQLKQCWSFVGTERIKILLWTFCVVNYQEKRKQAKASQRVPQSQVILFYLLISASAFHLKSGDDIASPHRHIMKMNPLMSLKHFDCQRNAHNYINSSVLWVGFE